MAIYPNQAVGSWLGYPAGFKLSHHSQGVYGNPKASATAL